MQSPGSTVHTPTICINSPPLPHLSIVVVNTEAMVRSPRSPSPGGMNGRPPPHVPYNIPFNGEWPRPDDARARELLEECLPAVPTGTHTCTACGCHDCASHQLRRWMDPPRMGRQRPRPRQVLRRRMGACKNVRGQEHAKQHEAIPRRQRAAHRPHPRQAPHLALAVVLPSLPIAHPRTPTHPTTGGLSSCSQESVLAHIATSPELCQKTQTSRGEAHGQPGTPPAVASVAPPHDAISARRRAPGDLIRDTSRCILFTQGNMPAACSFATVAYTPVMSFLLCAA